MAAPFLVDTDVVIDYLREFPEAVAWWESFADPPSISVITVAELYAGVREGRERTQLQRFLSLTPSVPVGRDVAEAAGLHLRQFRKSHGVLLPDALVAATAQRLGVRLTTLNTKHFPMLPDVLVPYTKS